MLSKQIEHILSLLVIGGILCALFLFARSDRPVQSVKIQSNAQSTLSMLSNFDIHDPFFDALLRDVMDIYFPGQHDTNAVLIDRFSTAQDKDLTEKMQNAHVEKQLDRTVFWQIFGMYIKFLVIYCIVMALTFYGVQTIAVFRFCRKRQHLSLKSISGKHRGKAIVVKAATGIGSFVLFCPAYVIAYSIRSGINTDTAIVMTILCVISNGLLIVYANKFYTYLLTESRKGYVDTAIVKNLNASYDHHCADGISLRSIFRLHKRFPGHVFGHVFTNAQFQYVSAIKEQASFLITGMIITEMALNIHGFLNYEMLRQMLYRNYDSVVLMVFMIFCTVKLTEMVVDGFQYRLSQRYENKNR